jgi:hypothetical protein
MIDQSRLPVTNIEINISSIIPMKNKIPNSIAYPPDLTLYTSNKTTSTFCQTVAHHKRKIQILSIMLIFGVLLQGFFNGKV